ncbi:MAG TPA: rhomboid family intramembrane serine protease, partial [Myxococcales bacterium]|nr:rhomboid family intramembrane serine protease [Myxococcales bacterium]
FLHETALGPYLPQFIEHYGLVPYVFVHWGEQFGAPFDPARFLPLFTSMFWHGGWGHLLGNMLFLWIFGDNVEDRLGHFRFVLFYVGCGLVAALTQVALSPDSTVPTVGASGAIAGVLGAYLISFPRSRVLTLVLIWPVEIPAIFYLAFWFVMQVLSGVASLGAGEMAGGVAWWAHIGGFLAGIAGVALFAPASRRPRVYQQPL